MISKIGYGLPDYTNSSSLSRNYEGTGPELSPSSDNVHRAQHVSARDRILAAYVAGEHSIKDSQILIQLFVNSTTLLPE
jgi:hypothetical protein